MTAIQDQQSQAAAAEDAQSTSAETGTHPWRRALIVAGVAWISSRIAYALVNVMTWRAGHMAPPEIGKILSPWGSWDSGHFLRIAAGGYGQVQFDNAFFPLYPMLIRAFDTVLPAGGLFAALVVSNIACLGFLILLQRLTELELGEQVAQRTVFYLIAFPTAFFLAAPYNTSLFLLLTTGALYAMRRGNWWLAGALAGLASATRSSGVLLALPFVFEYLRQRDFSWRRIRWDALAVTLVPSGLIAFSLYCWRALGDPLAFTHAQQFWYRVVDWPFMSLWNTLVQARHAQQNYGALSELTMVDLTDFAAGLGFLVLMTLCVVGPWKLRRDQLYLVIYGFIAVLFPLVNPATDERPLISMVRLVLECLPAFMILGRMGANRYFDRIYPMPAIALQVTFLLVFLHYDWIA